MGDDITIGVTEIVNNIEVTAQPNDQIIDISVVDNTDEVTLNITPTVIEINVNKGSSYAKWGTILGTLSDQEDLQDALDLKADLVDGKVPSSQLPSYVDDVIEVADYAALPATGESGKIYITIDNNKIYRWTGSTYVEITDNTAVWGAITGTLSSQTDLSTALNAKALKTTTISTNAPLSGGGDLSANRTLSISQSGVSTDGYLSSTDWNTFNNKQNQLNGTGFVKASGTTISYDNTSYLPLSGGTMTGQIVLKESSGSTDYTKGLRFPNDPFGGTMDVSGIRLYSTSGENQVFEIYIGNDSGEDIINFATGSGPSILSNNDVKINGNTIWNVGNLPSPISGTGTTNYIPKFTSSSALGNSSIYDNGTGAIGIGVTPSAWDTVWKVLQISKGSYFASDYSNIMAHNLYVAGEDTKYISSNLASQYEQNSGSHYWYTAPTGTAGANMTLSPRMTLDNSGKLGLGVTSPDYGLHIQSDSAAKAYIRVGFTGYAETFVQSFSTGGFIGTHNNYPLNINTNNTPRIHITSGGAINIKDGTLTGTGGFEFTSEAGFGARFQSGAYKFMAANNSTEYMRITSNGDLAFGKQSVNWTLDGLQTEGQGRSIGVTNTNSQNNLFLRKNDTTGNIAAFYYNSTAVGTISITSSSTSYNTSSDYRLKEDLQPMVGALERLQNLKPVNFAWKSSGERVDGFIAHELAEVIPEAVTGEKDATKEVEVTPAVLDEEGNIIEEAVFETVDVYQGIDQSKIVPLLVAAMQELKAEIELLKAK